jgi:hypothetical protein
MKHKRTRQITITDNLHDRVYRLFESLGIKVEYDGIHRFNFHKLTDSKSYVISGTCEEVGDKVYLKVYYDHKNVTLGYFLKDCVYTILATIPPDFPVNHNEFLIGLYEITEVINANI